MKSGHEREGDVDPEEGMDPDEGAAPVMLFAAFACGALFGAACGILLAPARGRETRGWIAAQPRAAMEGASRLMARNHRLVEVVRREGVRGLWRRQAAARAAAAAGDAPDAPLPA